METFPETTSQLYNCLKISAEYIQSQFPPASISVVLGSGLSQFYKRLTSAQKIPFTSIPFMPSTTVKGHVSVLYYGYIEGIPVYCWGGRLHGYEGYSNFQISYISHLSAFLSCHTLLVTNASGSALPGTAPGDIILVSNHINHFGKNPLDTYIHTCFRDLNSPLVYNREIIDFAKSLVLENSKFKCHEGTYFWVRGPCFETAYEVECYHKLGGDLFGMSTIPEVLAAQAHGMRVLVTAVVSNLAVGLCEQELTHELVNQNIMNVQGDIEDYFVRIITQLPEFTGTLKFEWTEQVAQNCLKRKRIEVSEMGKEIRQAAGWVKALEKGKKQIEYLIVANCVGIDGLTNTRKFYLSDIPNMIISSHASSKGKVLIGDYSGKRVAVVLTEVMEGLNLYESYFLLRLFESLRVSKVHYLFQAFTQVPYGGVKDFLPFRLHGTVCWPKYTPSMICPSGEHLVLAFSGPTCPSAAEFSMCEKVNFVATIANMGILTSASTLGIAHSASFYGADRLLPFDSQYFARIFGIETTEIDKVKIKDLRGTMHTPGSPEELEDFAEICKKYNAKVTFIVTQASAARYFTIIDTISFEKLPYSLHFTAEQVLIIEGAPILLHEGNHSEMMYPYFLSNLLACNTLVILDHYCPVVPTDHWVRVTKHCGIANYNPLFGKNIDKWGVRFPDMSNCYDYNPNWEQPLRDIGVTYEDGGVVITSPERNCTGEAILKFAEFFEAKGVVKHGVYPVIVSQHKLEENLPRKLAYFAYPNSITEEHLRMFSMLTKDLVKST